MIPTLPKKCINCETRCMGTCKHRPDRLRALNNPWTVETMLTAYTEPVTGVGV